jgi:methylase of polypeptide subunit release factors
MKESADLARKIVGDNSRLGRSASEFYPTPHEATIGLILNEKFEGNIWEPACGKGDISEILKGYGYDVKSSDINNYGYGEINKDFLNTDGLFSNNYKTVDNIITNPPFNLALEFILQSKMYADKKIAMFLKTSFLEGVKRYGMFKDKKFPLKCIYQFSKRISFGKSEGTHKNGGMIAFAWFIWDKEYEGKPYINWIL